MHRSLSLFPWYDFPTVLPIGDHPIVKNLDREQWICFLL